MTADIRFVNVSRHRSPARAPGNFQRVNSGRKVVFLLAGHHAGKTAHAQFGIMQKHFNPTEKEIFHCVQGK
jgi:hypothetical protein